MKNIVLLLLLCSSILFAVEARVKNPCNRLAPLP